jgi:hypothetical protein
MTTSFHPTCDLRPRSVVLPPDLQPRSVGSRQQRGRATEAEAQAERAHPQVDSAEERIQDHFRPRRRRYRVGGVSEMRLINNSTFDLVVSVKIS